MQIGGGGGGKQTYANKEKVEHSKLMRIGGGKPSEHMQIGAEGWQTYVNRGKGVSEHM